MLHDFISITYARIITHSRLFSAYGRRARGGGCCRHALRMEYYYDLYSLLLSYWAGLFQLDYFRGPAHIARRATSGRATHDAYARVYLGEMIAHRIEEDIILHGISGGLISRFIYAFGARATPPRYISAAMNRGAGAIACGEWRTTATARLARLYALAIILIATLMQAVYSPPADLDIGRGHYASRCYDALRAIPFISISLLGHYYFRPYREFLQAMIFYAALLHSAPAGSVIDISLAMRTLLSRHTQPRGVI